MAALGDTVLVRVRPGEVRVARVDHKHHLRDFAIYRPEGAAQGGGLEHPHAGDIILGRVKKVAPGLGAAFVDVGAGPDGFLGLSDARAHEHAAPMAGERISDYVHEGQSVIVQIVAEARDDKGPKVTLRPTLAGALCVLTPGDGGVRVSKRVSDEARRVHLRTLVAHELGADMGCVVRSAAALALEHDVKAELQLLTKRWDAMAALARRSTPPARLNARESVPVRFLGETGMGGIQAIVIDDAELARETETALKAIGAGHVPGGTVERFPGGRDLFVEYAIADDVEELTHPVVALPSGGTLIIEETAALTAIDVNAAAGRGRDAARTANLEAVREAARHMRLRNLCGLIVLDLIPVKSASGGAQEDQRLLAAMREAMASDPAGPFVLGMTKGGLMEITRPRRRAPLSQVLLGACPVCLSDRAEAPLTVGLRALETVLAEVRAQPALVPVLQAPGAVIHALRAEATNALAEMETRLGQPLDLEVDETLAPGTFRIRG